MEEPTPSDGTALEPSDGRALEPSDGRAVELALPSGPPASAGGPEPSASPAREAPQEGDRNHSPTTDWPPWTAAVALIGGLVLAAVGGLLVDLPALALGVSITSSHTPQ